MKKILITGVTGQDGAYFSTFLIDKNFLRKNEIAKLYGNPSKLFLHFPSLKEKVFDIKETLLSMIKS